MNIYSYLNMISLWYEISSMKSRAFPTFCYEIDTIIHYIYLIIFGQWISSYYYSSWFCENGSTSLLFKESLFVNEIHFIIDFNIGRGVAGIASTNVLFSINNGWSTNIHSNLLGLVYIMIQEILFWIIISWISIIFLYFIF
jgi:hypothetical protein